MMNIIIPKEEIMIEEYYDEEDGEYLVPEIFNIIEIDDFYQDIKKKVKG